MHTQPVAAVWNLRHVNMNDQFRTELQGLLGNWRQFFTQLQQTFLQ